MIYGKTKPFVIGNGNSSISELVERLNLPDKSVVQDNLKELDLNYVPASGEKVNISWKHNLSGGAKPTVLQRGELYDKIQDYNYNKRMKIKKLLEERKKNVKHSSGKSPK